MSLKSNFELMADYNQRMNNGIFQVASQLGSCVLSDNRGTFFGSVMGTLNHILVGDIIWLKRFSVHPERLKSLDYVLQIDMPKALDSLLYNDFKELRVKRNELDNIIMAFTRELTNEVLSSTLCYSNTKGELFNKNIGSLIQHLFNHQTHHRGQVSTLLNQLGLDVGATDFLVCIKDEKKV